MEKQHNRVRSSLQASECLTDRKDRVLLHAGTSVSMQPTHSFGAGKKTGEYLFMLVAKDHVLLHVGTSVSVELMVVVIVLFFFFSLRWQEF